MTELQIGGYVNFKSDTFGIDSYEHCFSKEVFENYPHEISYQFNELGYRERPIDQYKNNAVIVIGDSFTVGLGLPQHLTYPSQLEKLINHQVLNFGLNGASNDWIARKLPVILNNFEPLAVIVHYTFSHRRELNEPSWFDDERTLCDPLPNQDENFQNWQLAHNTVQQSLMSTPVIYSHIPNWHQGMSAVNQFDFARDNFHYGELTCSSLAHEYADYINQLLVH